MSFLTFVQVKVLKNLAKSPINVFKLLCDTRKWVYLQKKILKDLYNVAQ